MEVEVCTSPAREHKLSALVGVCKAKALSTFSISHLEIFD